MTSYTATIEWERADAAFTDRRYSPAHRWTFDGGTEVPASSSPALVPLPMSRSDAVDPEEAFVAALASCHMLWFLSIAADRHFVVDSYRDVAAGEMGTTATGRTAITHVTRRPMVRFTGERRPDPADPRGDARSRPSGMLHCQLSQDRDSMRTRDRSMKRIPEPA